MQRVSIPNALEFALQQHQAGRRAEAEAIYRQILALEPNHSDALHLLGIIARQAGRNAVAIELFRKAITLHPNAPAYHYNLGNALRHEGRLDEAIAAFHRVIDIQPDHLDAHNNLGVALRERGRLDDAVCACRRAIEIQPGRAEAYNNLGAVLSELDRLDEAIAAYRRALELKPDCADAHMNLGSALKDQGQLDEASSCYAEALRLTPDDAEVKWGYSFLLLLRGEMERGWPLHEARWDAALCSSPKRNFRQPMWCGEPLNGRRVLVHAEQGLGDSIQFIRYVPMIVRRGGVVVVECPRPLVVLFRNFEGISEFVAMGESLPPFDLHVPMLSLPLVFKTTLGTIPRGTPYLAADPAKCEPWRERLRIERARLRVGLAWAGNVTHSQDRRRSIPLARLLPLVTVEGIDFFSLQKDRGTDQIRELPAAAGLTDCTQLLNDFADTAALIAQLDLVISVDTAILHLAGALGRPAWALLPFAPDWRWLLNRDDSPWYPTMRLFRQPRLMDWEPVIDEVREQLQQQVRAKNFA